MLKIYKKYIEFGIKINVFILFSRFISLVVLV